MQLAQVRMRSVRVASAETVAAIRFALLAAVAGVGFLALSAMWMSTCTGGAGRDTLACGPVQYTLLDLGGPAIMFVAAAWAFCRGYLARGAVWHGAGAALLVLTAVSLIPAN